ALTPAEYDVFSPSPPDVAYPPAAVQGFPVYPPAVAPPGEPRAGCPTPNRPCAAREGPFEFLTRAGGRFTGFPNTLLWTPPLAATPEPRTQGLITSLDNATTQQTVDPAIGLTAGLLRFTPPDSDFAVQFDAFAVVFSRFSRWNDLVATDFRVGLPVT